MIPAVDAPAIHFKGAISALIICGASRREKEEKPSDGFICLLSSRTAVFWILSSRTAVL
jgi:hypothetical protein